MFKKVILLTNILTPYRIKFYELLYDEFIKRGVEFKVLVTSETEPNRNWTYSQYKKDFTVLNKGRIISLPNNIFIHINWGIKLFFIKEKPNLVISAGTYLYPALWQLIRIKKKFNIKVYYWNESHEHELRNYNKIITGLREYIRQNIFTHFDGYWFAGQWSLEFINRYSKKNVPKIFVPNLIDNVVFDKANDIQYSTKELLRKEYILPIGKKILLCPARLNKVKGQLDFLKNFQKIESRNGFVVLFVGDGDDKNEIEKLIAKDDCWNIKLLGYKTEDEMIQLYSISDYLLLPSNSDPNPLTCIESIWCSLPLIVSNHVGNAPEIIKEGVNGYILNMEDSTNWNHIFAEIANNDEEWMKNARAYSYKLAHDNYNSRNVVKRIVTETVLNE